jgi:hypothetical protein
MADDGLSAYSKKELRQLAKAFSLMGDDAVAEAKNISFDLANYAKNEIASAGAKRDKAAKGT